MNMTVHGYATYSFICLVSLKSLHITGNCFPMYQPSFSMFNILPLGQPRYRNISMNTNTKVTCNDIGLSKYCEIDKTWIYLIISIQNQGWQPLLKSFKEMKIVYFRAQPSVWYSVIRLGLEILASITGLYLVRQAIKPLESSQTHQCHVPIYFVWHHMRRIVSEAAIMGRDMFILRTVSVRWVWLLVAALDIGFWPYV